MQLFGKNGTFAWVTILYSINIWHNLIQGHFCLHILNFWTYNCIILHHLLVLKSLFCSYVKQGFFKDYMSRCSSRSSPLRTQLWFPRDRLNMLSSGFVGGFQCRGSRSFSDLYLLVFKRLIWSLICLGRVMDGAGKCNLCHMNPSLILSWWYGSELLFSLSWVFVNIYVVFTAPDLIILYAVSANTATCKWMREIFLLNIWQRSISFR